MPDRASPAGFATPAARGQWSEESRDSAPRCRTPAACGSRPDGKALGAAGTSTLGAPASWPGSRRGLLGNPCARTSTPRRQPPWPRRFAGAQIRGHRLPRGSRRTPWRRRPSICSLPCAPGYRAGGPRAGGPARWATVPNEQRSRPPSPHSSARQHPLGYSTQPHSESAGRSGGADLRSCPGLSRPRN